MFEVVNALLATAFGLVTARLLLIHPAWVIAFPFLVFAPLAELRHRRIEAVKYGVLERLEWASRGRQPQNRAFAAELIADAAQMVFGPTAAVRVISLGARAPAPIVRGNVGAVDSSLLPTASRGTPVSVPISAGRGFAATLGPPSDPAASLEVVWSGKPRASRASRDATARALLGVLSRIAVEADLRSRLEAAAADATSSADTIAGLAEAGGGTQAAIRALRDAGYRIARLTDHDDAEERATIVAELDRAGRALATLVGAVTSVTGTPASSPRVAPIGGDRPAPALSTPEGRPTHIPFGRWEQP